VYPVISGILAAAVYVACKDTDTPRSMKEVSKGIDVNKKMVARCYGVLINKLDLVMPITDPIKFVPAIASRVKINEKTKRKALGIIKAAKDHRISLGKNPRFCGICTILVFSYEWRQHYTKNHCVSSRYN
jgi:transcription initiation factor TFIIB